MSNYPVDQNFDSHNSDANISDQDDTFFQNKRTISKVKKVSNPHGQLGITRNLHSDKGDQRLVFTHNFESP